MLNFIIKCVLIINYIFMLKYIYLNYYRRNNVLSFFKYVFLYLILKLNFFDFVDSMINR